MWIILSLRHHIGPGRLVSHGIIDPLFVAHVCQYFTSHRTSGDDTIWSIYLVLIGMNITAPVGTAGPHCSILKYVQMCTAPAL